jgi:hypothetical protein
MVSFPALNCVRRLLRIAAAEIASGELWGGRSSALVSLHGYFE